MSNAHSPALTSWRALSGFTRRRLLLTYPFLSLSFEIFSFLLSLPFSPQALAGLPKPTSVVHNYTMVTSCLTLLNFQALSLTFLFPLAWFESSIQSSRFFSAWLVIILQISLWKGGCHHFIYKMPCKTTVQVMFSIRKIPKCFSCVVSYFNLICVSLALSHNSISQKTIDEWNKQ